MAARPALFDVMRWSSAALRAQAAWQRCTRRWRHRAATRTGGRCPLCGGTAFVHVLDNRSLTLRGPRAARAAEERQEVARGLAPQREPLRNPREDPLCLRCGSVPRQRALALVLAQLGVPLATATVHEASPSLPTFRYFRARCPGYVASYFVPGVAAGARIGAFRCVDLTAQPFAGGAFDLVVTQDVLEHVPDPARALREIHRTLRPGGRHVFTVPRTAGVPTRARAELRDGTMHLLMPAQYHGDPTTRAGSLVVTDWGMDLERLVADRASTSCVAHAVCDALAGIPVPVEVFVAPNAP